MDFHRILLYREENRPVRVHNKSTILIYWQLAAIDELDPQISFSPTRGWIKPKESATINFVFHAKKVYA